MRISFGTPLKYAHKSSVLPFMSAGRIHYKFVFNEGTADLVFQDLMEQSIKVAGCDRMGKTIIPLTKQDIAELEKTSGAMSGHNRIMRPSVVKSLYTKRPG